MVVAGKIFRLSQPLSAADVATKLNGYHTEEEYEEGDYKFTLISEVTNLNPQTSQVTGVYSYDYVINVFHRGTSAPLPRTVEAMFSFAPVEGITFLTVVERKHTANLIAKHAGHRLGESQCDIQSPFVTER